MVNRFTAPKPSRPAWAELKALNDADSIVANSGGYLIAAGFFALPVAWLAGYVVRINQILSDEPHPAPEDARTPRRLRTKTLTVREVEVAQLVSAGMTNEEIAQRLFLSARTIQSHAQSAMRKTRAKNRAELAALAVREGLVPPREGALRPGGYPLRCSSVVVSGSAEREPPPGGSRLPGHVAGV